MIEREQSLANNLKCPFCVGSELKLVTDTVRFNKRASVYGCQVCGLVFLDQHSFELPKDFYEKEYHQTYLTHVDPDALNPFAYYDKMKKATKVWADKFSAMLTGNETVLDVGCSVGHFIDLIKERTKKCYGHELSIKEVAFCREVLKLDVNSVPLRERFGKGTFDYITLIFVLEHIAEPQKFLRELKEYLKHGGKMVIVVPNAMDALLNLYDIPEFKTFYYCIEHLFYYTSATLDRLFSKVGLSGWVETIQEYPLANHLNWAYFHKASETLAARQFLPNISLQPSAPMGMLEYLWKGYDQQYREFLAKNGYGDRLWCVVENKD